MHQIAALTGLKNMHEALVLMFFPVLGAHTTIMNFSIMTSVGGHFVLK
jgi:hypothetical protein